MPNKFLIPILIIVPILLIVIVIGGSASYLLYAINSKDSSITQISTPSSEIKKVLSSVNSLSKITSSIESTDNNGEPKMIQIYGTITAPVRIAEQIPTICLDGNDQKFCKPEIKVLSPNSISYTFNNIPTNSYDLTYSYNFKDNGGWMILPDRGTLADLTSFSLEENGKVEVNVGLENFERLRQEKIQKVKAEFGSRPDCVKQTDYFYKCSGVGKSN